jgi:long-chain acyl-CoA synthetase
MPLPIIKRRELMAKLMDPRCNAGDKFYDEEFHRCYERIGYPKQWIDDSKRYAPGDSYIISHPSWYRGEMPSIPEVSIYDLFHETVKGHPDDTAIIFFDKKITYRDLDTAIGRYAAFLRDLGIKKGDVVAAMLPNSMQHWVAFYGAVKIGAIHTPINAMYQEEEIAYQVDDSGARILFVLDLLYERVRRLKEDKRIEHIIVTNIKDFAADDAVIPQSIKPLWDIPKSKLDGTLDFFESIERYDPLKESFECGPKEDLALLLYTAGTTGRAKGVMETHFNLVYNSLTHFHMAEKLLEGNKEVHYAIFPMFHTGGYLVHSLPTLYQGGTVIPIPLFDLEEAFRLIETYGINALCGPPTLYIALMSREDLLKKYDLKSLKLTTASGGPVPPAVQKRWRELTDIGLTNGWGMTETNSGGSLCIPGSGKVKPDSIGYPVYAEMKIVDESGQVLPRREEGEILFRGLQVAKGYWNKPEETKETFLSDGWLRTGDRGYIDQEDFVYFVDRIKDLIIASGYNIAPVEIENVLYEHPAVAEAAVIGIPHEYRGETVKAFIALKDGFKGKITEEEIIDFCRKKLATFKVPRVIEFRDVLPKSLIGKVLRRVLREEEVQQTE